VTHLGDTEVVVMLASVLAAWYAWRHRSATAAAFLVAVIAGQWLAAESVRTIVERARPALSPRTGFSGDSFPSGHATAAMASYLAFAFVLGAGRPRRQRAALIGAAAGIGVAVASTRVVLGVHWLTDAVAGVALGTSIALLAHATFARRPRWWRVQQQPSSGDDVQPDDGASVGNRSLPRDPRSVEGAR
jgi:undecaprenyl-diphosphatase